MAESEGGPLTEGSKEALKSSGKKLTKLSGEEADTYVKNSVVLEESDPCKREDKVNGNEKIKRLKGQRVVRSSTWILKSHDPGTRVIYE